jgi:hypothetical protein
MVEDLQTGLITEYFSGGWRIAPFFKTPDGYIGVKAWPKRAATNMSELQTLIEEQQQKSQRELIFGVVPSAGKFVVDIDTKNNPQAMQLWKNKVFEGFGDHALATPNLVVKTKSGGYHLYYSDGSKNIIHSPTAVFGKDSGVDIRGYTGMVVAPTSIGTELDWQTGEYVVIRGRPADPLTVLPISKILGEAYDAIDHFLRGTLAKVNDALRNDNVSELNRHRLLPDDLIIPASNRDNTLYRCARLCRLAGLSQEAAAQFMGHLSTRCETSPEEPLEHWQSLSQDKVKRVYENDAELKMKSIASFYEEMDNAGAVLLRNTSKSYYYFKNGSKQLRIDPRSTYSTDNIGNVLQGVSIQGDEETVPAKKVVGAYLPKEVAYSAAMYPKLDMPYFDYEGNRYVNTYHDPFSAFEPNQDLLEQSLPYVEKFGQFVKHITGYEEGDDNRLLDKLAWIVQKPYRRLPSGTIIYSHTRGSGKDNFMGLVREIVGPKYYMPISLKSLANPHTVIHDKIVCCASEVQLETNARGSKAAAAFMGELKDLITAKNVDVNEKFVQSYTAPIFSSIFVLSNFDLSAIIEPGDRRWDVMHSAEVKFDQQMFGALADVGSDGVWLDRDAKARELRRHIVYALRRTLQQRAVDPHFDRQEASMNEVKRTMMEHQNPPALEWMFNNLPTYFTEEVAMMACHFCPMRTSPEYIMKQLREHFGPALVPLYRAGRIMYRVSGAPRLEVKDGGGTGPLPVLNFDVPSTDQGQKRIVYRFTRSVMDTNPTDTTIKHNMAQWYHVMKSRHYGAAVTLPNQKPAGGPDLI